MSDVVYAIGDIHGRLDLLRKMERTIAFLSGHIPANAPLVLTIGDYCDVGPDSKGVYERLLVPGFAGLPRISLLGNHDIWIIRAMTMFRNNTPGWSNWLAGAGESGISETLKSFGVPVPRDFMNRNDQIRTMRSLCAKFPSDIVSMIQAMPPLLFEGGLFFVHAGLNPSYSVNNQDMDDCIMGTPGFWADTVDFGAPVCVGHRVFPTPFISASNRIFGLDTGAAEYGILTAGVFIQGKPYQFISVCNPLDWIPVIVDQNQDHYLGMTRLWWREVMKASPEPPILAFDDKARLDAFVRATRITSFRHVSRNKGHSLSRRPGHRILDIASTK